MTPAERSTAARHAVTASWAYTPDRAERTAPARRRSPVSYEYWLDKLTEEGRHRPEDLPKAAESAHKAYMTGLSRKAAAARKRRADARKPK